VGKRHRRIRALSATGQVAGAATEQSPGSEPIVQIGLPTMRSPESPRPGRPTIGSRPADSSRNDFHVPKRTSAGAAGGGFSSCLAKQASAARRWRRADLVRSTIPRIETPRGPAGGVAGQCWTEQTTGSRPAAIAGHHRPPRAGTVRFSLTRASRRVGACRGLFRRGLPGSGPATLPPGLGSDLQRVKGASPPASRHRGRRRRSQRRGGRGHPRSVAEE
jgi:hypothetical protein